MLSTVQWLHPQGQPWPYTAEMHVTYEYMQVLADLIRWYVYTLHVDNISPMWDLVSVVR